MKYLKSFSERFIRSTKSRHTISDPQEFWITVSSPKFSSNDSAGEGIVILMIAAWDSETMSSN